MSTTFAATQPRWRAEIVALQLVVAVFLGLRLWFDLSTDPFADEAYYWMWGQHPALSYYDHPPLHAWLLWGVEKLLGWQRFSVRALTWVTLFGVLAIFWDWSRRFSPEDSAKWFWRIAAAYLASPFYFAMTAIAYNDHLLVFLGLLAIHCFVLFTDKHERGEEGALRWLYGAAIALGLATLTKYNGIVIGLGFLAAFLIRPKLRALFGTPHPWVAATLAVAMQAPVIYWNLTAGFASYKFHMQDRWGGASLHFDWVSPFFFLILNIVLLSPVLVGTIPVMLWRKPGTDFEARLKTIAVAVMAVSSLGFLAVTAVMGGYFYWNILAFVAAIPLIVRVTNRWFLYLHLAYGLFIAFVATFNFAVAPIAPRYSISDRASSINLDWNVVAEHLRAARAAYPTDLIGGTRFSTTSQVGYALGTSDVVPIAIEPLLQYSYWFDPQAIAGKSVIILTDEPNGHPVIANLGQRFERVTQIDEFPIVRLGQEIYRWRIFRGENYRP